MKFLNKKILFKIVIIALLIIIGGIVTIFYWPKTHIPTHIPSDISPEATETKAKCLEDVAKMTDDELINKINNLKNPGGIIPDTGEERLTYAHKNIINYLICKVEYDRNEESYNRAKEYIERLTYINKENKESVLNRLDNTYSRRAVEDSFTLQLALMDLDEICPDKISNLCLEAMVEFDIDAKEFFIDDCKNMCNLIEQYSNNQDKLYAEIINNKEWTNDNSYYESQRKFRIAVAYHFGKQNLALKICDNVNDFEKDKCLEWVEIISNQENKVKDCNDIRKELEKLICQLPANEIE